MKLPSTVDVTKLLAIGLLVGEDAFTGALVGADVEYSTSLHLMITFVSAAKKTLYSTLVVLVLKVFCTMLVTSVEE